MASSTGWSPLLCAAEKGHLGIVKILLETQARVDSFDKEGKAAIHLAAENGYKEVMFFHLLSCPNVFSLLSVYKLTRYMPRLIFFSHSQIFVL